MITEPVVLILGAGASAPYGFPLGVDLVDAISRAYSADRTFLARMNGLGFENGEVNQFCMALQQARPYSIDAFIQARGTVSAIPTRSPTR